MLSSMVVPCLKIPIVKKYSGIAYKPLAWAWTEDRWPLLSAVTFLLLGVSFAQKTQMSPLRFHCQLHTAFQWVKTNLKIQHLGILIFNFDACIDRIGVHAAGRTRTEEKFHCPYKNILDGYFDLKTDIYINFLNWHMRSLAHINL